MTKEAEQQIAEAKTIEEKIKAVNKLLHDGEPGNISIDNYSGFTGYKPQFISMLLTQYLSSAIGDLRKYTPRSLPTRPKKERQALPLHR